MKWQDTSYANNVPVHIDKYWSELLQKNQPDIQERVQRTVKQWNSTVRDLIRNETGLRLNIGTGGTTTAQVKVVDGISEPLAHTLDHYRKHAKLLLHEPLLQTTVKGLKVVEENYDELHQLVPDNSYGHTAHEAEVIGFKIDWLESVLEEINRLGFKEALTRIEEDTLGAYFFNKQRINIYWVAIGIYAAQLDISIEGLTLVVLIHELAHAYTHLGKDIDGVEWNTKAFARSDLHIVEGMAQFYTRAICKKLENRIPSALKAFEVLLECQSPVYTDFQGWAERSRHQGEIVRFSMIQCRSNEITDYKSFLEIVQSQRV